MIARVVLAGRPVWTRRPAVKVTELSVLLQCTVGDAREVALVSGITDTGATSGRLYDPQSVCEAIDRRVAGGAGEPLAVPVLRALLEDALSIEAGPVYGGSVISLEELLAGLVAAQRDHPEVLVASSHTRPKYEAKAWKRNT